MPKCVKSRTEILQDVATLLMKTAKMYRKESNEVKVQQKKRALLEYIKSFTEDDGVSLTEVDELSKTINDVFNNRGIIDPFFSSDNIKNILTSKDIQRVNDGQASTEQIVDSEASQSKNEVNKRFLDEIYGLATDVKDYAVRQADQSLFDCCFISRGFLFEKSGIVKNEEDLNNNIRQYKELLFKRITDYLNDIINNSKNLKLSLNKTNKSLLESLQNPHLYIDEKYSGILEKLDYLIKEYITSINTDQLSSLYQNRDKSDKAKKQLDAFNAYVMLKHFDSYLSQKTDIIKVDPNHFNDFQGKYFIQGKTAKLASSWRTKDPNFYEEADRLTSWAVETTPLYAWGTNTPIEGRYMNLSDLGHIISKIKELSLREDVQVLRFDNKFINDNEILWESLSKQTKEYLQGKTLSRVINSLRENPLQNTSYIFELLTNSDFYDLAKNTFMNERYFNKEELDKMYSLSKGIFHSEEANSLRTLCKEEADINFYNYITQTVDSVFKVNYLQYYRDENGIIQIRTFIDQSVNNIQRNLETSINTFNSIKNIKNFNDYKNYLDLKLIGDSKIDIQYKIPNTNILVKVIASSGNVTFYDLDVNEKIPIKNFAYLNNNGVIDDYIDNMLRLGLSRNSNLKQAILRKFSEQSNNPISTFYNSLLSTCARITLLQNVQDIQKDESIKNQEKYIENNFGKNKPKYNYQLSEIGLIHGNDVNILRRIAVAKADLYGLTTATQVKDGEGNGQSLQTLSRLLGSFRTIWDWASNIDNNPIKDLLILEPGILEQVYTAKEYSDFDTTKSSTDMNPAEMAYSEIVYDFIGGLIDNPNSKIVGKGKVLFLPSVNSDKSTIGRILVNLNKTVNLHGSEKSLRDLNPKELQDLISFELGSAYSQIYDNIKSDFIKLQDFIALKGINIDLAEDYLNNFDKSNLIIRQLNSDFFKTPVEFVKYFVKEYNKEHRLNPIELVDQIHFKDSNGNLTSNKSFIAQLVRYNPNRFSEINEKYNFPSSDQFWNIKKAEVLKDLLKSNFKINTLNTTQEELLYIKEKYPNWIDNSGNMILGKVQRIKNGKPEILEITSKKDLFKIQQSLGTSNISYTIDTLRSKYNLILNPILEQYNYLNFLFTEEFKLSTVGTFLSHPDKSNTLDVLKEEDNRILAQDKRNVQYTAAMHAFQLNLLEGIPDYYNISIIEDIHDLQGTVMGTLNDINPFDSATFVNPIVVILENNSLGGARAGITKKQFVHFYNPKTGNGGIIKTAGFGLTNDWIRNSPFLENMVYQMLHNTWINEDESQSIVDITKDFRGNTINYGKQYFKRGNRAFEIVKIESLGNNRYKRYLRELSSDENGQFDGTYLNTPSNSTPEGYLYDIKEDEQIINNNYDLWKYFGGQYSLQKKGNYLEYSNSSFEQVTLAVNKVGAIDENGNIILRKKSNGQAYTLDEVETQKQIWQPLKNSDIHYIPTIGAVKHGGANINPNSSYNSRESLDFQRIKMLQAGIQLDKEHHADQSDLSLMTQVISSCGSKGYTFEAASKIYNALNKATKTATNDFYKALKEYIDTDSDEDLQNVVIETIINSLSESNSSNFATKIAENLIDRVNNGEKITWSKVVIPLSDNTIYAKILSTLASYLTKSGIKQKIPGILSVLTPSYKSFKVYTNAKGETVKYESFTDPESELELAQLEKNNNPIFSIEDINNPQGNISNIEIGRDYIITEEVPLLINLDFQKTYNGESLEQEFRKLIYNRFYDSAPPNIKSQITKIINGNSNTSLAQIVDKLVEQKVFIKSELIKIINKPLSQDEHKDLRFLLGRIAKHPELLQAIITNSKDNVYKALKHYGLEDITDPLIRWMIKYKVKNNIPTKVVRNSRIEHNINPITYKKLKEDAKKGKVIKIIEYVKEGRDLASYNARFTSLDGRSFQIYDLDSISILYEFNDLVTQLKKNRISQEEYSEKALNLFKFIFSNIPVNINPEYFRKLLYKQVQSDLQNISSTQESILDQYDRLVQTKLDPNNFGEHWFERFTKIVKLQLGQTGKLYNSEYLTINGKSVKITASNFDKLQPIIRKLFEDRSKVKIDNELVSIDKSNIQIQPYELILPKIFATNYGLSEFDDLNTILQDKYYFVKQYIKNMTSKLDHNQYSIELKRSKGDHIYLATKRQILESNFTKVLDSMIPKKFINGKQYRTDVDGNELYEITDDFELYTDSLGNEIIVSDNLDFYISSLSFDSINLSSTLERTPSFIRRLLNTCKYSKNKKLKNYYNFVTKNESDFSINNIILENNEYNTIPEDASDGHFIIKSLLEKHSSFVQALNVIAARIPAQSMQSFMPMKIVAFDNPDINTAYVSTMQILLQGSKN